MTFITIEQKSLIGDTYKIYYDSSISPFELYNIVEDAGENTDFADSELEKLAELEILWNTWHASRQARDKKGLIKKFFKPTILVSSTEPSGNYLD